MVCIAYYPPQKDFFWGGVVKSGMRVRPSACPSVRPVQYLTNQLTFCSETLHIYLLPLCYAFSQVSEKYNKIPDLSTFYEVMNFFKKSFVYGKGCPNFQLFPNLFVDSVTALWSNIYFVGDVIALVIYL